jgi:subtilisin family serine protease
MGGSCDDPPATGNLQISIAAFHPGQLQIESILLTPTRLEAIHSETLDGDRRTVVLATNLVALSLLVSNEVRPELLGAAAAPVGFIHEIRLVTPDGTVHTGLDPDGEFLTIPSGSQSGIKAAPVGGLPFPVRENETTHILVLLDAGEKIHAPGCGFDAATGECHAEPPPRGEAGRETPAGRHVFPDYILEPSLPARLLGVSGPIAPQFAEDQLFVMFESGTPRARADELGAALDAIILRQSALGHPWYTYLLPPGSDERVVASSVQMEPEVRLASPNYSIQALSAPPPELAPENQLPDFVYDPFWLERTGTFDAWDDIAAARGEPARYGDPAPIVAVLDQAPYPYTPDLEENLHLNPGELLASVSTTLSCGRADTSFTLLDTDTNGDGAIDGADWDVNEDGSITLADFNMEPFLGRINEAIAGLAAPRAPDDPFLIEDLIKPDGLDRDAPTCGLFEDGADNDGNLLVDDLAGFSFYAGDNWTYSDPQIPSRTAPFINELTQHGTKVAGFIAAAVNDVSPFAGVLELESYVGVAPRARLLQVALIAPSFDETIDETFMDRMTDSIDYAVAQGADVISTSWVIACAPDKDGIPELLICDDDERSEKADRFEGMFDELELLGLGSVLFVAAGPNEAVDIDRGDVQAFPAELDRDYIIRVTSSTDGDDLAPDTAFGDGTFEIAAPGEGVIVLSALGRRDGEPGLLLGDDGTLSQHRGISFAVPQVAGAAALMLSICPALRGDPVALKNRIVDGADCGLDGLAGRVEGACRLNVANAVRAVMPEYGGTCP